MDYETRPTNRRELRLFSKLFRIRCGFTIDEPIDPLLLLDRLPDISGFENVRYEIVEDSELPGNVPAQCDQNDTGFIIKVKESIYDGAYEKNLGGNRMHIMHEIMHPFADYLGFKPIFSRELVKSIPLFRSLEWIVMALAGEVMMPYKATSEMTVEEIMQTYGVSKAAAEKRLKY